GEECVEGDGVGWEAGSGRAQGGVECVAKAGAAEERLDEEAGEGGVGRGLVGEEESGEGVVGWVEAEEVGERVERVGEEAGGGEGVREEGEVGRRRLERRRQRDEEAEGGKRVRVAGVEHDGGELVLAEVGEQAGEVEDLGGFRVGREVGGDEVDDGDVGIQGAREEGGQGARRNARHGLGHDPLAPAPGPGLGLDT
uniref:Uncharacterized protein n=1 Tax=Triticum urartu TaxID=4572 RepID=A0A8R7RAJ5_TRIUA